MHSFKLAKVIWLVESFDGLNSVVKVLSKFMLFDCSNFSCFNSLSCSLKSSSKSSSNSSSFIISLIIIFKFRFIMRKNKCTFDLRKKFKNLFHFLDVNLI